MPKAKKSDSASEGLSHQDKFYRRNPLFLALAESLVELTTEGTIEEGPEGQKFMGDVMADLDQVSARVEQSMRAATTTEAIFAAKVWVATPEPEFPVFHSSRHLRSA